jgi:hypothetical protein
LTSVLSLGEQYLTGVFPENENEIITKGPLELCICNNCALVQLSHSYDLIEMYGDNYGYRSGLNPTMIEHLQNKAAILEGTVDLLPSDFIIDIGSNDATLLKSYKFNCNKVGIDPTGNKFSHFYPKNIDLIADFFSKKNILDAFDGFNSAKIITSIAMFYDLCDPQKFICDVRDLLDVDGVWHFEQSYLPTMIETNSYDTICHEHLEYYSLTMINKMLRENGMKIIDVKINEINGGSFAVTACKKEARFEVNSHNVDFLIKKEKILGIDTQKPFMKFRNSILNHKKELINILNKLKKEGKIVHGYGASTKGNVILQFCGITNEHIDYIAEVNPEKFNKITPGTNIKIISETESRRHKPDYYLVLPWHFKNFIIQKEHEFIKNGGKLIFPLPNIEIISNGKN